MKAAIWRVTPILEGPREASNREHQATKLLERAPVELAHPWPAHSEIRREIRQGRVVEVAASNDALLSVRQELDGILELLSDVHLGEKRLGRGRPEAVHVRASAHRGIAVGAQGLTRQPELDAQVIHDRAAYSTPQVRDEPR
jgi:hypothetical protein